MLNKFWYLRMSEAKLLGDLRMSEAKLLGAVAFKITTVRIMALNLMAYSIMHSEKQNLTRRHPA
jgi:hypothetical protein